VKLKITRYDFISSCNCCPPIFGAVGDGEYYDVEEADMEHEAAMRRAFDEGAKFNGTEAGWDDFAHRESLR
jgi:hypothetical protein